MKETMKSEKMSLEHIASLEKLCGGVPDAISILARSVRTKGSIGIEKTGSYADIELNGSVSASHARVVAARELHKAFPRSKLITNSFVERTGEKHAKVTALELQRGGVMPSDIIVQDNSYDTHSEILELIRLIVQNNWRVVTVVVNEFQLARTQAFFDCIHKLDDPRGYWQKPEIYSALEAFKKMTNISVKFLAAEDVLKLMGPRYQKIVESARALPIWQETVARETEGARQVRAGEYWGRPFRQ